MNKTLFYDEQGFFFIEPLRNRFCDIGDYQKQKIIP